MVWGSDGLCEKGRRDRTGKVEAYLCSYGAGGRTATSHSPSTTAPFFLFLFVLLFNHMCIYVTYSAPSTTAFMSVHTSYTPKLSLNSSRQHLPSTFHSIGKADSAVTILYHLVHVCSWTAACKNCCVSMQIPTLLSYHSPRLVGWLVGWHAISLGSSLFPIPSCRFYDISTSGGTEASYVGSHVAQECPQLGVGRVGGRGKNCGVIVPCIICILDKMVVIDIGSTRPKYTSTVFMRPVGNNTSFFFYLPTYVDSTYASIIPSFFNARLLTRLLRVHKDGNVHMYMICKFYLHSSSARIRCCQCAV